MKVVVSGSGGLVGSEASEYFGRLGHSIIGIDNDMRRQFFGQAASTRWNVERLIGQLPRNYFHQDMSIDACMHSVFGASKLAADVLVQE